MADKALPAIEEPPGDVPRRGWLMPRFEGAGAWAETVAITLIALVLGWLADPTDPLHVKSQFPWVWFAPVLVALRYGVIHGVSSAALIIVAWYVLTPDRFSQELPKLHVLGGLLLTLVCGEFGAGWRLRLRRSGELNNYLDDRIERVTRQLYLLRLSHDRLEQELLARPTTMRDALTQLRARISGLRGTAAMPGATELLQFLAQHCQLEVAALYASDGAPDPTFRRVAQVGAPPDLDGEDPLLAYVLESGELAHVQIEGLDQLLPTPHIVVCPVATSDKRLVGVLVVSRLPFFALNTDQLQLMRVLTGAYADGVTVTPLLESVRAGLADASEEFVEELARLLRIQREFGIASHVVAMTFGASNLAADAHQLVLRQRRSPDVIWVPSRPGLLAFVNLLPVSGAATVEGYLDRTQAALRDALGGGFEQLRVRAVTIPLADADPVGRLARALAAGAPS